MRILIIIFSIITFLNCSNKQISKSENTEENNIERIILSGRSAIQAKLPLKLDKINFDSDTINLDNKITSKIGEVVTNYLNEECNIDDNLCIYQSAYLNTICIPDSLHTIYLILLEHYPTRYINSKILFYNNQKGEFINDVFDFNLHALYNFDANKLVPTDLKKTLNISSPEIEIIDYNDDDVNDYKFSRLWHVGTSSAIESTILSIFNNRIDTLLYERNYPIEFNL